MSAESCDHCGRSNVRVELVWLGKVYALLCAKCARQARS